MTVQLVRHGKYDREGLTQEGRIQSIRARDLLLAKGLGKHATILTSSAPRAIQTAEIIAEGVGDGTVHASEHLFNIGQAPEMTSDFDGDLEEIAHVSGLDKIPDQLVVVAHMPLLSLVEYGDPEAEVPYAAVVPYELGNWPYAK